MLSDESTDIDPFFYVRDGEYACFRIIIAILKINFSGNCRVAKNLFTNCNLMMRDEFFRRAKEVFLFLVALLLVRQRAL